MQTIITAIFLLLFSQSARGELVQIRLIDNLDEPRGYCIDIRGHKEQAKLDKDLQVHTCYSYQGLLGVDQAFEKILIRSGKFYLPYFDVCMEAEELMKGARLVLRKCNSNIMQDFEYTLNKQIKHAGEHNLCISVSKGKSRKGGGGSPTHLIRFLKIDECLEGEYQHSTWEMIN